MNLGQRQKFINLKKNGHLLRQIAVKFKISIENIQKIAKNIEETDNAANKPKTAHHEGRMHS